jgi:hypothetical protein
MVGIWVIRWGQVSYPSHAIDLSPILFMSPILFSASFSSSSVPRNDGVEMAEFGLTRGRLVSSARLEDSRTRLAA